MAPVEEQGQYFKSNKKVRACKRVKENEATDVTGDDEINKNDDTSYSPIDDNDDDAGSEDIGDSNVSADNDDTGEIEINVETEPDVAETDVAETDIPNELESELDGPY